MLLESYIKCCHMTVIYSMILIEKTGDILMPNSNQYQYQNTLRINRSRRLQNWTKRLNYHQSNYAIFLITLWYSGLKINIFFPGKRIGRNLLVNWSKTSHRPTIRASLLMLDKTPTTGQNIYVWICLCMK